VTNNSFKLSLSECLKKYAINVPIKKHPIALQKNVPKGNFKELNFTERKYLIQLPKLPPIAINKYCFIKRC
jgi:hypothetical protein